MAYIIHTANTTDQPSLFPVDKTTVPKTAKPTSKWGQFYLTQEIIKVFDEMNPVGNTVGTQDGNQYVNTIRASSSVGPFSINNASYIFQHDNISDLYPEKYQDEDSKRYINGKLRTQKYMLHCYDVGGVFVKHTDGQKSARHFATLLLFPPAAFSPFEGGDLVLYPPGELSVPIFPSKFTKWTVVAFELNVAHECTPVISGKRFVFKTELELPPTNMFFSNKEPSAQEVVVDVDAKIVGQEMKIARLQEKLRRRQQKIEELQKKVPSTKVQRLIKEIEDHNDNVCLVLQTDAATSDPTELDGQEAIIWNLIAAKWPYSSLQVMDTSHYKGDGENGPSNDLDLIHSTYDDHSEIGKAKILYWKSPVKHQLGLFKDTRSEYNDNTYDNYYDLTVTLICVQKKPFTE